MPAVARLGDPHSCGDTQGQGSGNVFSNYLPIARINQDYTAGHCYSPALITTDSTGQNNVFVNNKLMAKVGDPHAVHCCGLVCHGGFVAVGSPNVFVNS